MSLMHWLQILDKNLFLFVNQSLANPFFDWLMPVCPAIVGGGVGLRPDFCSTSGSSCASGKTWVYYLVLYVGNLKSRKCCVRSLWVF